jgi:hypothetical protein
VIPRAGRPGGQRRRRGADPDDLPPLRGHAGLLDAVADRGFSTYVLAKVDRPRHDDPVQDLREGWDLHVEFGLGHPALYALMYGDPRPGHRRAAAAQADTILHHLVHRVAEHGRLRTSVDVAAGMFGAAGIGVVLTLLGLEPQHRDLGLSSTTCEALLAAITVPATAGGDSREPTPAGHAVALRALLPEARDDFTRAELPLLEEWLDRIASRES